MHSEVSEFTRISPDVAARRSATLVFDRELRIVWHDAEVLRMLGQPHIADTPLSDWFSDGEASLSCPGGCDGRCVGRTRWRGLGRDDIRFEVDVELAPLVGGQPGCCVAVFHDAGTVQVAATDPRVLAQAVAQTADSVVITDAQGTIRYVNQAFELGSGYSAAEAIGSRPNLVKSGRHAPEFFAELWRTIQRGDVFRAVFANRRKDGRIYYEEKTISPIRDDAGRISHYVSTAKDVTARVQADARLEYLANYDTLTGLANRSLFLNRLEHALLRAKRAETQVAVLFLDLDRFKTINDTLGHAAGDQMLRAVAERISHCVRAEDTAARIGGDEFTVILEGLDNTAGAQRVAEQILEVFATPVTLTGHDIHVGVSIGIAMYPSDGENSQSLLRCADIAMYRSKEIAHSAYLFYSESMRGPLLEDLSMENALREALTRNEFYLDYQPMFEPLTQRIAGFEALLRWQSPTFGLVPPARFIPMLEESGLIGVVGRWVMLTACAEIGRLIRDADSPVRLAVNVSGRQFHHSNFVAEVECVLRETGFPAQSFELEITESMLIENVAGALDTMASLHGLGIRLAIDDFGTGYSSLSYLRRFPISTLKIDRSFVAGMEESGDAVAIVHAVVNLGQALGLEVVGEGVENVTQLSLLTELGCHRVQGYLLGRPAPLERWRSSLR